MIKSALKIIFWVILVVVGSYAYIKDRSDALENFHYVKALRTQTQSENQLQTTKIGQCTCTCTCNKKEKQ